MVPAIKPLIRLPISACALVAFVALVSCRAPETETPEQLYARAYTDYRAERYPAGLDVVNGALQRVDRRTPLFWNFRLLKVELLLGWRQRGAATEALNFELPAYARTPRNEARYQLNRGFAAYQAKDYATAGAALEAATGFARTAGDEELLAEIENRQGLVAVAQSRFGEAATLFRGVREYGVRHAVPWLTIGATGNLGFQLMSAHQYNEAIPFFEQAIDMARQYSATESKARNTGNLGWCYLRLGDSEKAFHLFQEAQEQFRKTGDQAEEQRWIGALGSFYVRRGFTFNPTDLGEGANYFRRALEISRQLGDRADSATWLTNLAYVSIETGKLDEAERYNQEGLAIKRELHNKTAETFSEMNAARIAFGRGRFEEAREILERILRSSPDDPTPRLQAHDLLAIVLATENRYGEAEREFRTAIGEIEQRRTELVKEDYKRGYFSRLIGFYQDYIELLMDEGKTAEALELADSSRARTMADRLRISRPHAAAHPRLKDFQAIARATDSTLLSYSLGHNKSWLWIISAGGMNAVTLPREAEIRALIENYDRSILDLRDPLMTENPAARKLYDTLVAPAQPFVEKTGKAIVVPDGVLYSLNFETLPTPGEKPHYWIEDAMISIAPSLGLLNPVDRKMAAKTGSLLVMGDPVSPAHEFPALPFAAREIGDIEASLPRARKVVLRGAAAKPAAWAGAEPGSFDLIHFAAHATASVEEPLESSVILSRDGAADYRLRAADIVNSPLRADLVTISACHSAGTRIYSGEGLVGLAWAFLDSGAHNVIAGLWDVDDEAGASMMKQLYAGLGRGESPSSALRGAKLQLIRSGGVHRKPWYWGAFQLFGT